MSPITLKRTVILKVRVTEAFKEETLLQLQQARDKVDLEIQQVEFQGKKMLLNADKQSSQQSSYIKQQIEEEKQKRLELKQKLTEKLREVKDWENGLEVVQDTVEGYVNLQVGDDWNRLMYAEILLENGKVIEIR